MSSWYALSKAHVAVSRRARRITAGPPRREGPASRKMSAVSADKLMQVTRGVKCASGATPSRLSKANSPFPSAVDTATVSTMERVRISNRNTAALSATTTQLSVRLPSTVQLPSHRETGDTFREYRAQLRRAGRGPRGVTDQHHAGEDIIKVHSGRRGVQCHRGDVGVRIALERVHHEHLPPREVNDSHVHDPQVCVYEYHNAAGHLHQPPWDGYAHARQRLPGTHCPGSLVATAREQAPRPVRVRPPHGAGRLGEDEVFLRCARCVGSEDRVRPAGSQQQCLRLYR
eukprot:1043993-Rhodomonas_salina.1